MAKKFKNLNINANIEGQLKVQNSPTNSDGNFDVLVRNKITKLTESVDKSAFDDTAQTLSISNDSLSISGGNTVVLSTGIPLTGTEVGSPVTGDIEISGGNFRFFQEDSVENIMSDFYIESLGACGFYTRIVDNIVDKNDISATHVQISPDSFKVETLSENYNGSFFLTPTSLEVNFTESSGTSGIYSSNYYGANYTDNTYVQKKYVDDNFAKIGTTAPLSATDTGTVGEIRVTATYIYTCVATDTWVRAAVATW